MKFPLSRASLSRPRLLAAIAVFGVSAHILYRSLRGSNLLHNQYDDSYITYRYAIHFARGHGLVFNVGEKTDAASSFAYTILLALFYRIGFHDLETVAVVIGIVSAAWAAAIVFYASSASTRSWVAPLGMALVATYHGMTTEWDDSGMETTFYGLIVTAILARFFVARKEGAWTVVLVCLAALTRVEGILLAGAWILTRLLSCHDPRAWQRLLRDGAWLVGTLVLFYGFKYAYYGTPLPHSFLFKEVSYVYRPRPEEVIDEWHTYVFVIGLTGLAGICLLPRRAPAWGLAAFYAISTVAVLRGPWSHQARYSAHLLPGLAMLGALSFDLLLTRLWPLAFGLAFLVYNESVSSHDRVRALKATGVYHQDCRGKVGQYIAGHAPPGSYVLSSDIGKIAYKAMNVSFIDTYALTSADVLEAFAKNKNVDAIVEAKKPRFVADTYYAPLYQAIKFMNGGTTIRATPPSELASRIRVSPAELTCTTPDGYTFQAAPIEVP